MEQEKQPGTHTPKKGALRRTGKSKAEKVGEQSEMALRVKKLADAFEAKLTESKTKVSVTDWIRLLALHEKLAVRETREIKVQWVEPETGKPLNEE